jgi:NADH dehydrogenase
MTDTKKIIVTGSSGFIGLAVVAHLAKRGFAVRAFQRKPHTHNIPNVSFQSFDLEDVRDEGFAGAQYMIHCAYQPRVGKKRESQANSEGTKRLIALCRKHNIPIVFLSTLSAHPRAESHYGKDKLAIEKLFSPETDLVLKLGLVLGEGGGLFGRMAKLLAENRVIPLIGGKKQIQTLALKDLCNIIEHAITRQVRGTKLCAHPEAIQLKQLYVEIARTVGAHPLFVPVPIGVAYTLARIAERAGITLPITSENVLGLEHLEVFETETDMRALGVPLQNYINALAHLRTSRYNGTPTGMN